MEERKGKIGRESLKIFVSVISEFMWNLATSIENVGVNVKSQFKKVIVGLLFSL